MIDVKSYYVETPDDVAERVRACLKYAPPERLVFAPDCGLEPDRALGGAAKAREHGRRRADACARNSNCDADRAHACQTMRSRPTSKPPIPGDGIVLWWLGQSGFLVKSAARPRAVRSVSLRFAHSQVRAHRQAARAHDATGDFAGDACGRSTSSRRATITRTISTPKRSRRCLRRIRTQRS